MKRVRVEYPRPYPNVSFKETFLQRTQFSQTRNTPFLKYRRDLMTKDIYFTETFYPAISRTILGVSNE